MLKTALDAPLTTRHLTVLGRVTVADTPGTRGLSGCRRRPLALLAILAASGERGISRERLLLYLWPESDARHGRNTLNQTLYALRRDLGSDQVVLGTTVLALNRSAITCDLWDFERAVSLRADEIAVKCYGGRFLNDFSIPGLPEFEQWADAERTRLERDYRGALERLAMAAEQSDDPTRAIVWWQRLADAAPLSSTSAMGLIRALAMAGDRGAALEYAHSYVALCRAELDSEPESEVIALVDRIRRAGVAVSHATLTAGVTRSTGVGGTPRAPYHGPTTPVTERPAAPGAQAPSPAPVQAAGDPAPQDGPPGDGAAAESPTATAEPRLHARRLMRLAGSLILIALFIAAAMRDGRASRLPPQGMVSEASVPTVAVLPFAVTAPDSQRSSASRMVELVSASLEGADVDVVDPAAVRQWVRREQRSDGGLPEPGSDAAARLRATAFVTGEIMQVGERIRVTARWYDLRATPGAAARDAGALVTFAVAEGEPARLPAVVDQIAVRLLAGRQTGRAARLTRAAAEGTQGLAAFKAYLRGERELGRWEYARALDEFSRAAAADTTFALAYYRMSVAAKEAGRPDLARDAALRAAELAGPLAEHERSLVHALVAVRLGQQDTAERLYNAIVEDYPDDVEAWFHLGDLLFHGNPLVGRSALDARRALEQVIRLDPTHEEALMLLARIAAAEERRDDVDSLLTRLLSGRNAAVVLESRVLQSLARHDRVLLRSATVPSSRRAELARPAAAFETAVNEEGPAGAREFARTLTQPQHSPDVRALGFRLLARAEAALGRWTVASAFLDSAQLLDAGAALEERALLAAAPFLTVPDAGRAKILAQLGAWSPRAERTAAESHVPAHAGLHAHVRLHGLGLLHAARREHEQTRRLADSLERLATPAGAPHEAGQVLAQSVRATSAFYAGHYADVLRILGATPWPAVATAFEAEAHDRFIRAEALRALGRYEEAAGWYGSIAQRAAYELVYLAPSERRLGEMAERRGEYAEAARHYRRFVDLWAGADPALQPQVQAARQRLAALPAPTRPPVGDR